MGQRGGFIDQSINGFKSKALEHLRSKIEKGDEEAQIDAITKLTQNPTSVLLGDDFDKCTDLGLSIYMENLKYMTTHEKIPDNTRKILLAKLNQLKETCGAATLGGRRRQRRSKTYKNKKTHIKKRT